MTRILQARRPILSLPEPRDDAFVRPMTAPGPRAVEVTLRKPRSVQARIAALADRHSTIERDLKFELRRPLPDGIKVLQMKRAKLRLKDDMAALGRSARDPVRAGSEPAAMAG